MTRYLLMGGLGNQLFQLAGALHYSKEGSKIVLEDKIGNPRTSNSGKAEVSLFELPQLVCLKDGEIRSTLVSKVINFGIRLSATKQNSIKVKSVYKFISKILARITLDKNNFVNCNNGVGYDPNFQADEVGINVGYFQSYLYVQNSKVTNQMKSLQLKSRSKKFIEIKKTALTEQPIVMHVRLGDYKNEDSFGIPSLKYYANSLQYLMQIHEEHKIWLFSNEPDEALAYIPKKYLPITSVIPNEGLSSSETLELMRYGKAYIIANSSFSWWGATMSYTTNPTIICPKPWFKSGITPAYLIPSDWVEIDAEYE